jgi:hypothetical protein
VFQFINTILTDFQNCFNRVKTWQWFARLVIGFMIRNDSRGVTAVVSALRMKPELYTTMLRFFRSGSFLIETLYRKLIALILRYGPVKEINGALVLIADHIKISKEGLRMAGIRKLHQESQNSGKGEYIQGHNFGVASILGEKGDTVTSIPVMAAIHESKASGHGESIIEQMGNMLGNAAKMAGKRVIAVCDAYFFAKTMLSSLAGFTDAQGLPLVELVTRAKKNAAGYTEPPPRRRGAGRPRIYGNRVKLKDCFRTRRKSFSETEVLLYGKQQKVRCLCLDLLWRPAKRVLRFVLTDINGKRFILMSSDCSLEAKQIIELYGYRFKIEVMFDDIKNGLGGFKYHFWTKSLDKRKRGGPAIMPKDQRRAANVRKARTAIEVYVCLHIITYGILSILAIRYEREIWNRYTGWLRTVRTKIPTLNVTKQVIAQEYFINQGKLKRLSAFAPIVQVRRPDKFLYRLS